MNKILCIYHKSCADGFASAWAVHRKFGDGVEFVAAKYGDDAPSMLFSGRNETRGHVEINGRDILIVDFSYPRAVLEAMAQQARSVLVLDHHATAAEELAGLPTPPQTWEKFLEYGGIWTLEEALKRPEGESFPKLAAIFDMHRSGAGLTWDYLHPGVPRPRLIDLVEDRDLWKFDHDPDTRRFHAVAASYGYGIENLKLWDDWYCFVDMQQNPGRGSSDEPWHNLLTEGEAILRYEAKLVDGIVSGTRRTIRLAGHVVPLACCPGALASEVGNRLCLEKQMVAIKETSDGSFHYTTPGIDDVQSVPFSTTYYDADGRRHFSLRSTDASPFHCGDAARALGERFGFNGGGHKNSAGFDAPLGWEGD